MSKYSGIKVARQLLLQNDPEPVEIINADSDHPLLLVCEHAGQAVPSSLDRLDISQDSLDSHIGWDIGAGEVTRHMAERLGAPAILQRYSRLVIDCNRPHDARDSIPQSSDLVSIPGNLNLDYKACAARIAEIFDPYQQAVDTYLTKTPRRIVLSIHSFTRLLQNETRPWEIAFLYRRDTETSLRLSQLIENAHPKLTVGMNVPYQIDDDSDWFVPQHGEANSIPHSLIEIRNDQIDTTEKQTYWAQILVDGVERYLKEA